MIVYVFERDVRCRVLACGDALIGGRFAEPVGGRAAGRLGGAYDYGSSYVAVFNSATIQRQPRGLVRGRNKARRCLLRSIRF